MFVAPRYPMQACRHPAPSGSAGIFHSAAIMRRLIDAWRTDPAVLQTVASLVYTQPEKMDFSEASAIFGYVQGGIRYLRDPAGIESIASPVATMGRQAGDCDDQVVLLGTLLEAAGYPVRLVIASYGEPGAWEHVYLQALLGGQWVDMDPTEHEPIGWAPPDPSSLWIEPR